MNLSNVDPNIMNLRNIYMNNSNPNATGYNSNLNRPSWREIAHFCVNNKRAHI